MKTTAIVPVYNGNPDQVAQVLASLKQYVDDIIVVDDGSDKYDYQLLVASYELLVHSLNRGQGAALQTGTDFAVKNGADIIVHFDSDGQHNPEDIPALIKPIKEGRADFIFGSRYLLNKVYPESRLELAGRGIPSRPEQAMDNSSSVLTRDLTPACPERSGAESREPVPQRSDVDYSKCVSRRDPSPRANQNGVQDKVGKIPFTKRKILHPLARLVNYLLTGLKLSDAHNGLRAFRATIADQVYLSQDRMAHATEYLQLVKQNKIRYTEVAVRVSYNQYGQGLKGGVKVVKELLTQKVIKD